MKKHLSSLFVFRQDLRTDDNIGLWHALQRSKKVLPLFILDENILAQSPPDDRRLGFLVDALKDLDHQLQTKGSHLQVYRGEPLSIIQKIVTENHIEAVYCNRSYGIGSQTRDLAIQKWCHENGKDFFSFEDFLLVEPSSIEAKKIFTPYYKKRQTIEKNHEQYTCGTISPLNVPPTNNEKIFSGLSLAPNIYWPINGRKKRIEQFNVDTYEKMRNFLYCDATSKLSPYIRFGIVSIRSIYWQTFLKTNATNHSFISELAWRDFWHHITYHFPESTIIEFQSKRRDIQRENNQQRFEAWKKGETGYPIIDAIMRQLRNENWIHNRARMIVASFLTKDLLIDWRWGEEYFSRYLLDYDRNINIGNWQRSASVGADPTPLRIFSPILQAERFDPDARYITFHLPELKNIHPKHLHNPIKHTLSYHKPIVDHNIQQKLAKELYQK